MKHFLPLQRGGTGKSCGPLPAPRGQREAVQEKIGKYNRLAPGDEPQEEVIAAPKPITEVIPTRMNPIDLIYRYDPAHPEVKPPPATAEEARRLLEDGNRLFRPLDRGLRVQAQDANIDAPSLRRPLRRSRPGHADRGRGHRAERITFAVLFGCSATRQLAGRNHLQSIANNLFVVRVAGNVLSDECFGSIEYAIHHLADSIRIIVVLGHTNCGPWRPRSIRISSRGTTSPRCPARPAEHHRPSLRASWQKAASAPSKKSGAAMPNGWPATVKP